MLLKNKSVHCGNPCFFLSSETQKIILIHLLPYSGTWQEECWDSLDYLTTAMWSSRHVILLSVFWVFFKVICEQCNNSLDRNQNNLQYLFYFPSATTYVTATRSEKYQNVHSSLPHAAEISENIYVEHAKKLWSGDNWDKHSELIPAPVAQVVFRLADCMDWQNWIFGAEHLALKTWPNLLCAFLRFSHWIISSLLP